MESQKIRKSLDLVIVWNLPKALGTKFTNNSARMDLDVGKKIERVELLMTQQNLRKVEKLFSSYLESYEFVLRTLQRNGISPAHAEMLLLNNEKIADYLDDMNPPNSSRFIPNCSTRDSDFWEDMIEKFVGDLTA